MSRYLPHIALGSVVLVGVGLLWRLKRTAQHLEVIPRLRVHSVDFKNLTLVVDTLLKNPTTGGLKIWFPFVKLLHGGTTVGSSEARDEQIAIPSFGQIQVPPITVEVPLLNLAGLAQKVLDYLRGKTHSVELEVQVLSQADAILGTLPVEVSVPFTLQRKAA